MTQQTPRWQQKGPYGEHVEHPTKGGFRCVSPEAAAWAVTLLNALEARVARAEAKAALADEIGIGGYRHSKATWTDWLARYDALDQSTEEA